MGRYSNQSQQAIRIKRTLNLLDQTWPERDAVVPTPPHRLERRLTKDATDKLVQAYQAGATGRELASQFGIARSSVMVVLRSQGIEVRRPRLTPEECEQIVALYTSGMRQFDVAKQVGRDKGHVWHVLRRAGLV